MHLITNSTWSLIIAFRDLKAKLNKQSPVQNEIENMVNDFINNDLPIELSTVNPGTSRSDASIEDEKELPWPTVFHFPREKVAPELFDFISNPIINKLDNRQLNEIVKVLYLEMMKYKR